MHQTIPLSSVRMNRLSAESRTGSRCTTDNTVSASDESRPDALLEWRQAHEAEGAPVERLHIVVAELCRALSNALGDEREAAKECIQRAVEMLQIHGAPPGATDESGLRKAGGTLRVRGGLVPSQIRRLTAHIEANLDTTLRTRDLAALVRLSPFYFCRVFRNSLGEAPHAYVMRRRMERAQGLMLLTDTPLGQIAADCGLADQAHFSKLFRRFAGESPGAWRRARATVP
ncbi:MAG: helix-turn-helix-domain containing protein AraC type [Gammaproteobacteria bacterium]|nr:helix-turn-helix-domain containing protein AraC type [Gammaproteobacteria bacterium]